MTRPQFAHLQKIGSVIESVDKLGQAEHQTAWHIEDAAHKGEFVKACKAVFLHLVSTVGRVLTADLAERFSLLPSTQPQAVLPVHLPSHLLTPKPFPFPSSSVIHLFLFPIFLPLLYLPSLPSFLVLRIKPGPHSC